MKYKKYKLLTMSLSESNIEYTGIKDFNNIKSDEPKFKILKISKNTTLNFNILRHSNIDFVLIERTGHVMLNHYMTGDMKKIFRIIKYGFHLRYNQIPVLGRGVYGVKKNDYTGFQNMINNIKHNDDKIHNINYEYCGKYYECIYGNDYIGYIVIPEDNMRDIKIIDYETDIYM